MFLLANESNFLGDILAVGCIEKRMSSSLSRSGSCIGNCTFRRARSSVEKKR